MSEKERYAIVNVPDANSEECQRIVEILQELELNLPYRLLFVCGAEWKTVSREEFLELMENDKIKTVLQEVKKVE